MGRVNLETFAGGALQEQFDDAMEKVLANLMDPNTPWKNKRRILVEVTFEQNEDRNDSTVNVSAVPKLAPVKPVSTRMAIGKDLKTGKVFAEEYGSQCRGQMTMEDYQEQFNGSSGPQEAETDKKTVDTETGETKEESQVVDFRKARQA